MSAKILKGKGDKPDDVFIGYVEHFPDGSIEKGPGEFTRQPHPDFKDALAALRVHLAILADQIDISQTGDTALIEKFHVHGFHITGDKNKGFVILGAKDGKYGRVGLQTRNLLFESPIMKDEYPLSELLVTSLEHAQKEVAAYIRGKRLADGVQELFSAQVAKPIIFPEQETDVSHLYGLDPGTLAGLAEIDAKERLDRELVTKENPVIKSTGIPQADPEAMKSLMAEALEEMKPEFVKKGTRKVKQTPENRSGEVAE